MSWPPTEQLEDFGHAYHEFACSEALARELLTGGMTHVNGHPVGVSHMETLRDGRWILQWWPKEPAAVAPAQREAA